jgi:hypothetical protein
MQTLTQKKIVKEIPKLDREGLLALAQVLKKK